MWSQSQKEIIFFCFGTKNSIKKVIRLCNVSKNPKSTAVWSGNHYKSLVEPYKKSLELICEGHSHPSKHHDRHPSAIDVKFSNPGDIELIAFPFEKVVRGWVIGKSVTETIKAELLIELT